MCIRDRTIALKIRIGKPPCRLGSVVHGTTVPPEVLPKFLERQSTDEDAVAFARGDEEETKRRGETKTQSRLRGETKTETRAKAQAKSDSKAQTV